MRTFFAAVAAYGSLLTVLLLVTFLVPGAAPIIGGACLVVLVCALPVWYVVTSR